MYVARLENGSDEQADILDNFPYNWEQLNALAEKALTQAISEDEDEYLRDPFTKSVLRCAGIDNTETEEV